MMSRADLIRDESWARDVAAPFAPSPLAGSKGNWAFVGFRDRFGVRVLVDLAVGIAVTHKAIDCNARCNSEISAFTLSSALLSTSSLRV
jgi:hypothetical protein